MAHLGFFHLKINYLAVAANYRPGLFELNEVLIKIIHLRCTRRIINERKLNVCTRTRAEDTPLLNCEFEVWLIVRASADCN